MGAMEFVAFVLAVIFWVSIGHWMRRVIETLREIAEHLRALREAAPVSGERAQDQTKLLASIANSLAEDSGVENRKTAALAEALEKISG